MNRKSLLAAEVEGTLLKMKNGHFKFGMVFESRKHFHLFPFRNVLIKRVLFGYLNSSSLTRQRWPPVHFELFPGKPC